MTETDIKSPSFVQTRSIAKNGVIRAALLLLFLTGIVRVTGFVRELLVAFFLGASAHTDSYVFAYMLYDWASTVGLAVTVASLPLFTENLSASGSWIKKYRLYGITLVVVFVPFVVAILGLSGPFARRLTSDVSAGRELAQFFRVMSWSFVFASYVGLQAAILQSRNRFFLQGLTGAIVNCFSILLLVIYHRHWGAYSLVVGIVGGLILQICVQGWGVRTVASPISSVETFRDQIREAWTFSKRFLGIAVSQLLLKGMLLVDRFLTFSLGVGFLSCLSYGSRLAQLPMALIGAAVSTALLPYQLRLMRDDAEGYRSLTDRAIQAVFFLGAFVTAMLVVLAEPIVRICYQHGAFGSYDAMLTHQSLRSYAGMITPTVINLILTNILYCVASMRISLAVGAISLVAYTAVAIVLVHVMGFTGIGWATTLVAWAFTIALYTYLVRNDNLRFPPRLIHISIGGLAAAIIAGIAMNWMLWLSLRTYWGGLFSQLLFQVAVPGLVGAIVFYLTGVLVGLSELRTLVVEVPHAISVWLDQKANIRANASSKLSPEVELP